MTTDNTTPLPIDKILELNGIATIFTNGFLAGFKISIDGWNGETFAAFDRPMMESELFMESLGKALKNFMDDYPAMAAALYEITTATQKELH